MSTHSSVAVPNPSLTDWIFYPFLVRPHSGPVFFPEKWEEVAIEPVPCLFFTSSGCFLHEADVHGTSKKRSLFTLCAYVLLQLFMYEAMGLCPQGRGGELIDSAEWISNKNGKMFS